MATEATDTLATTPVATPVSPESANPIDLDAENRIDVAITHSGKQFSFSLPPGVTVEDLALLCVSELRSQDEYTASKFIAAQPLGLIDVVRDASKTIGDLVHKAAGTKAGSSNTLGLRLLATPIRDMDALRASTEAFQKRRAHLNELRRRPARSRQSGTVRAAPGPPNDGFTFGDIQPLPHLPHAERSLAYLHRLRDDVGVRHAMRTHKFRVGLLTEMDPLEHTQANHEGTSRTLGLNRNQGQVIELRLRTDAGDGYRDYHTVRRTLCHELAHNVHGPHDQNFWALCHQLEREVERADYLGHGGRTVAGGGGRPGVDFYEPPPSTSSHTSDDEHVDSGGWTGGSFVLGSNTTSTSTSNMSSSAATASSGSASREQRARAAEERLRRMDGSASDGSSSGNRPAQ